MQPEYLVAGSHHTGLAVPAMAWIGRRIAWVETLRVKLDEVAA